MEDDGNDNDDDDCDHSLFIIAAMLKYIRE